VDLAYFQVLLTMVEGKDKNKAIVIVLKMLKQIRDGKNKEYALHITERILPYLPSQLQEPICDRIGDIRVAGSVKYISGLEMEHGSEVFMSITTSHVIIIIIIIKIFIIIIIIIT
jgi:hypothetical protein